MELFSRRSDDGHHTKRSTAAPAFLLRHCEPTGRADARPMTGSTKQSSFARRKLDCLVACAPRNDGGGILRRLVRPHQIGKPLEQIMRVARPRRGFGVILHREYRSAVERDAAIG